MGRALTFMAPLAIVCTPVWQGEDVLEHAITCAPDQTLEGIQSIMTLGQATDNTAEIAQEATARNSRIRALIHGPREGRTLSVNLALSEISGE